MEWILFKVTNLRVSKKLAIVQPSPVLEQPHSYSRRRRLKSQRLFGSFSSFCSQPNGWITPRKATHRSQWLLRPTIPSQKQKQQPADPRTDRSSVRPSIPASIHPLVCNWPPSQYTEIFEAIPSFFRSASPLPSIHLSIQCLSRCASVRLVTYLLPRQVERRSGFSASSILRSPSATLVSAGSWLFSQAHVCWARICRRLRALKTQCRSACSGVSIRGQSKMLQLHHINPSTRIEPKACGRERERGRERVIFHWCSLLLLLQIGYPRLREVAKPNNVRTKPAHLADTTLLLAIPGLNWKHHLPLSRPHCLWCQEIHRRDGQQSGVESFSTNRIVHLLAAYPSSHSKGNELSFNGAVYDSCTGEGTFLRSLGDCW